MHRDFRRINELEYKKLPCQIFPQRIYHSVLMLMPTLSCSSWQMEATFPDLYIHPRKVASTRRALVYLYREATSEIEKSCCCFGN